MSAAREHTTCLTGGARGAPREAAPREAGPLGGTVKEK